MGHLTGKDVYRRLADRVDSLHCRVPYNESVRRILTTLFTEEEADLVVRMPYTFSGLKRIARSAGLEPARARRILESACEKGLVVDVYFGKEGEQKYMPSPMVIGIFEFTLMRTADPADTRKWAELFDDFWKEKDSLFAANFGNGQKVSVARTLTHEPALGPHVEILDYERASAIVDSADYFAIGRCSCRHEKAHIGEKSCDTPEDTCSSFGWAARYLVSRNMAQEVSRRAMHDNLARSRELGLVLNADNVQRDVTFMCHCCGCCCNLLLGITRYGFTNTVVRAGFVAKVDPDACTACGKCVAACPVQAVTATGDAIRSRTKTRHKAVVDPDLCLGCGVCEAKCPTHALTMERRPQSVLVPETTFRRIVLATLERGTLQNQLFDDPGRISHEFLRRFVGAVLKLTPAQRALASDALRSTFLRTMEAGAWLTGRGFLTRL